MTTLDAFELLLQCATARRAHCGAVAEKDAALDAVIDALGTELRRILSPVIDESEGDGES